VKRLVTKEYVLNDIERTKEMINGFHKEMKGFRNELNKRFDRIETKLDRIIEKIRSFEKYHVNSRLQKPLMYRKSAGHCSCTLNANLS
jgi:hypothetical protein